MKNYLSLLLLLIAICLTTSADAQTIAFEDFDSDLNLTSYSNNISGGVFSNAGDGFGEFQRLVSSSIPFNLSDDSVQGGAAGSSPFAADSQGPIGMAKTDIWFGITDTWNDDTMNAETTGTWSFDISSATGPLVVQADMVAMHDFAGSTVNSNVDFYYQIDGGGYMNLFTSTISIGETQQYTMDDGDMFTYDDPLNMTTTFGTIFRLTDNFQTLTSSIAGIGSQLDIQVRTNMDGTESFAFDNLRIVQVPEPGSASLIAMMFAGAMMVRRRR